jgi:hypothetical protein
MTDQIKTITVDGVEHALDSFGPEVKQLVAIHQKWEKELVDARLQVALVEAALRDLNKELTAKIQEALETSVDEEATAAEAPTEG